MRTVRRSIRPWPRSIVWAGGGTVRERESRAGVRERALVPFDLHHVMRGFLLHEEAGRGGWGMEGVGGHDVPGDVPGSQQVVQPGAEEGVDGVGIDLRPDAA